MALTFGRAVTRRLGVTLGLGLTLPAVSAMAAPPTVIADIAPVQSLVARVMQGVGAPGLIVPPGVSEHHLSLSPSQSAALADATLVFWIGPELEPWLEKPLHSLAPDATTIALLASAGTATLPIRDGATFEAHRHEDEGAGHAEDSHSLPSPGDDGHPEEGHEAEAAADHAGDSHPEAARPEEHQAETAGHDDGADHHDHDHDGIDPHAWLDPDNAAVWLDTIAAALSQADPDNALIYQGNAQAGRAELVALSRELDTQLAPVRGKSFVVFHDAYQYFEARYGVDAAGSINLNDGSTPGPQRLAQIRAKAQDLNITCALREPQYDPKLIDTVFEGMTVRTGVIDPLGTSAAPGPTLYPAIMRAMAKSLVDCAG